MGYREEKRTAKAIYVLKGVIRKGIVIERGKIFIGFANMKAAFDRLKRDKIWKMLEKKGVNGNLIRRIRSLFTGTRVRVEIGAKVIVRNPRRSEEGISVKVM